MASYFFHSENGHPHQDEVGLELASEDEARREAVRMLGDLIKGKPGEILDSGHLKIRVKSDAGADLFQLEVRLVNA